MPNYSYSHPLVYILKNDQKYFQIQNNYLSLTLVMRQDAMIISFGSKETEKIFNGERVKKIPVEIQKIGRRKLRMLNNSQNLMDLKIPPSNRLEKLTGKLKEYHSVRINDQWRITFIWKNNNSHQVTILDYHK